MRRRLKLKKIVPGLYLDAALGMSVGRELVWSRAEGRMWVARWQVSDFMGGVPRKVERKFDSLAAARVYLNKLLERAR